MTTISSYIQRQKPPYASICRRLRKEINAGLPKAIPRMYMGIPVWFIGGNAVVGFAVSPNQGVKLLFWNGQALKEPELKKVGSFKAAQVWYRDVAGINPKNLRRWLKKAGRKIWDYQALRKGWLKKRSGK